MKKNKKLRIQRPVENSRPMPIVRDLIVYVADLDIQMTLHGLIPRYQSLGIRPITFDIKKADRSIGLDSAFLSDASRLLRPFLKTHQYALVIFDRHGCRGENPPERETLEREVEENLKQNGWQNRSAVVVIDPELEVWVWSSSPHVATILGWDDQNTSLHEWLVSQSFLVDANQQKPIDPKGAMESVLRHVKAPWSSSIHNALASKVSFERCADIAFQKLRTTLRNWFPPVA